MPGTINVDTTNETVSLDFTDDKGNKTDAPAGATIAFTTSDATIATIAVDAANPLQGDITPAGAPGNVQIGATSNGTALEADGTTAIPDPDSVTLTVDPGAAAGERLTLAE